MSAPLSSILVSKPGLAADTLRRALLGAVLCVGVAGVVDAYTVTLDADAPQTIYLQVGVGSFTADYCGGTTYPPTHATPACGPQYGGGTPQKNTTINTVSVTLATAAVGNKTAQAMTTNSTAGTSFLDGYAFCDVPSQLYVGGFFRTAGANTAAATITATVPAALTSTTGTSIPFSEIQWTTGGNGDTGAEPFTAGTFVSGGVQTVGTMASNSWAESCWTFSYLNTLVPAAGTYTGAVLYTLSAP